jgi:hypothetical protein
MENLEKNYKFEDMDFIDDLRILRNKIAYDGFFVKEECFYRNLNNIKKIISKLKEVVRGKIE